MRLFYKEKIPQKDGFDPNRPESIWIPHIPFISSCDGLGANLNLYTLMDLEQNVYTTNKCDISSDKQDAMFALPFVQQKDSECDFKM